MADAKRPELVPTAECKEGRVKVELPNGKWQLIATCQADERAEVLSSRWMSSYSDIEPYHKKLREAMRLSLDIEKLKLLCADLELGPDFVGNGTLEWECQRVIDECKLSGRRKMDSLLYFLRSRRPDRTFPDLPPDEDPVLSRPTT